MKHAFKPLLPPNPTHGQLTHMDSQQNSLVYIFSGPMTSNMFTKKYNQS